MSALPGAPGRRPGVPCFLVYAASLTNYRWYHASFNDVELRAFCAFLPAVDPRANPLS
jgi:hypothetical protein